MILAALSVLIYCSSNNKQHGQKLTILFTGDIMLGRQVGKAIIRHNDPALPFRQIYQEISSADISIGNLECVFVDSLITGTYNHKKILFPAYRESAEGLTLAGFDFLSLANNHAMDFSIEGVQSTLNVLEKNSIKTIGLDSESPVLIKKNGFNIALFSFWMNNDGLWLVNRKNGYTSISLDSLANEIIQAKKSNDIVVLFMHWGKEYASYPADSQKNLAHLAAQAGADLIVGHGPHQIQGIEKYGESFIAYSLGNCIFDQKYEETKIGLVLSVYFEHKKGLVNTNILPIYIPEYIYAPQFIEGLEKESAISKLLRLSESIKK